jgi:hypothetical protein
LRSASTCRISAVDDKDSANPITIAAGHGWPNRRAAPASAAVVIETCARPGAENGVAQYPEPRRLQLETDGEQQHHDA